jgi:hypothetical protein
VPLSWNEIRTNAIAFAKEWKGETREEAEAKFNIQAAERLGALRDALEESGYTGHALERLLVRLLFCLFADKTGIFYPRDAFTLYLENHSREDGSDLGLHLEEIFELLDTPKGQRSKNVPEDLQGLDYVNGGLFAERLKIAHFDRSTRDALVICGRFDWSAISPAIFGGCVPHDPSMIGIFPSAPT